MMQFVAHLHEVRNINDGQKGVGDGELGYLRGVVNRGKIEEGEEDGF